MEPKAAITLREINRENYRAVFSLEVKEDQRTFYPRSNDYSVAEGSLYDDAWFRAIYLGDNPIGFVMLSLIPEKAEYFVWRFMIDGRHQRNGYGTQAMDLIIDHVKTLPNARELYVSHLVGNSVAGDFYQKMGFTYTGEEFDRDLLMVLRLGN